MLKLKNITKIYKTANEDVKALSGINVEFRKSEFVAILGQSGCGKTTLLNIIGGLDRYTDGDLIINGKSTKKFKDRDWDSYRNYSIGFVFQSYNLISHQTVLANVELALTISGYSKSQKRKKAIEALESVGLGDQIHKKPSQLSGGQMQRVAIARAIVNNPDIILADEPTGALDTKTSIQIMDLLKKISKDKLIIMVTHNPELAEKYSNRIIRLVDGKITDDTNPYEEENIEEKERNRKKRKTKMKFTTALHLSLNNLMTKKGRTILTSFAGSIGIIGIALILSLSTGVDKYITDIQKSTMISYPITIEAETIDLSSIISSSRTMAVNNQKQEKENKEEIKTDGVYTNGTALEEASMLQSNIAINNLTKFKEYLENEESEIRQYIGENGIIYSYNTRFNIYCYDSDEKIINTDGSTFEDENNLNAAGTTASITQRNQGMSFMDTYTTGNFTKILPGADGNVISDAITDNYEVIYGKLPEQYNEVVMLVDKNNQVGTTILYELGLLPSSEYEEILKKIENKEEVDLEDKKLNYEDIMNQKFYLIPACDYYEKQSNGRFKYIGDDNNKVKELLEKAIELKVTGIMKQKEGQDKNLINATMGYTKALEDHIIEYTKNSEIVKEQEKDKETNVLNGLKFATSTDEEKARDAKEYLSKLGISEKANFFKTTMAYSDDNQMISRIGMMTESQMAAALDQYLANPDQETLVLIYDNYLSPGKYDDNMKKFGNIDLESPSAINIYSDSFENKDKILECIDRYNEQATEENKITYTDYVGLLMSSVTTIINTISYVLIAFVSISLVVSSIMIAIITYISVLERTKEIGILRAMGTSKKDVSKIFKAETFIEGFISGLLGIGITMLLNIPISAIIENIVEIEGIAYLPFEGAIILMIISLILPVIAGLIPSKSAAKKDPAVVLRTE